MKTISLDIAKVVAEVEEYYVVLAFTSDDSVEPK